VLAPGLQQNKTPCFGIRSIVHGDKQIITGYYLQSVVCPFNCTYSVAGKILFQSQGGNLLNAVETVKINMVQGKSAMILPEDDERGTKRIFLNIEPSSNALNKTGLASSQLPCEKEDIGLLSYFPQIATQQLSLLGAMRI
jgi:hypothetical protein